METNYEQQLNKNIWKYYLFVFFGRMEFTVSIIVLFLLANNLSMTQVMILETIFTVALFFLEIPSGIFADKYGRKLSLILSSLALTISFILLGIGSTFFIFLLAKLFDALFWALKSGADSAFIYDTLKELKRENEFAKIMGQTSSLWMFILGFLGIISAVLSDYFDYRTLLFVSAFFFFIGFLIALTFKEPKKHKKIGNENSFQHLKDAIKFTINHKEVRNLIIYYSLFGALGFGTYFLIQPYYSFQNTPSYILGIAITSYFVFEGLGNLLTHYLDKKFKRNTLLLWLIFLSSIGFIGMFFVNIYFSLILVALTSFFNGVRDIFVGKEINSHTESHHRATVISIQSLAKSLMYAIFAPLIGLFVDIYSPSAAFLMMGIGLLIFFVYVYFLFKK